MKIKIEVMLRDAILDPQGNTIKKSLNSLGFKNVKSVRQGKLIEIDLNTSSSNKKKKNKTRFKT
jgi:phosphoribosylformylglycinamidine synthase